MRHVMSALSALHVKDGSSSPRPCTVALAFAGVALLAVVTGCTPAGHSRPVARVTACAPLQVPGYSNHRSYPPGTPTLPPPGTHIVRCFTSRAQAAGHGFPVAAPAGTLIVRGVFLEPTGLLTMRQCRAVAQAAGFAVPCPTVAPTMTATPPNCDDGGGCSIGRNLFVFTEEGFAVPPDYHGVFGGPDGHFVLVAWRDNTLPSACPSERPIRRVRIGGDNATIFACPPGDAEISGHVALAWVHRGVHVQVSFHGVNATNIDLDMAVARHLVWVSPPP